LLNAYGPAECSDDVAYHFIAGKPEETETVMPIGRPLPGVRLHIVDRWLRPVPVGIPGELCVAGVGVGRGYLNRPDLTARRFVPNPFAVDPGERLYRTGDRARYRADGAIEFLGRIDHQVKIRGFRIELGEIEAQLLASPTVDQAVVMACEDGLGGKRLVAYVVCGAAGAEDDAALADELRNYLSSRLPNYMVPAAFIRLDAMPLGANGKIDRKALPIPDFAAQRRDHYVAPRNPTEEILAGIWQEVLGVERIGVKANFFDLGGHSLLAVQVLSRVRSAFGVEIPLRTLFAATSIERLAEAIEDCLIEQLEELSEDEAQALLEGDV
jgi:acyl carrier protein